MYAVVRTGGKQYRVEPGDILRVEKIEAEAGTTLDLNEVLLVSGEGGPKVGAPVVAGAKVTIEVLGHGRHKKVITGKKHRRKGYRRKIGHRQYFTEIKVAGITA